MTDTGHQPISKSRVYDCTRGGRPRGGNQAGKPRPPSPSTEHIDGQADPAGELRGHQAVASRPDYPLGCSFDSSPTNRGRRPVSRVNEHSFLSTKIAQPFDLGLC